MKRIVTVLLALGSVLMTHPVHGADKQVEQNKKTVVEFYEKAINQKDFEAASKYLGPRYTQHNPMAADGPRGVTGLPPVPSCKVSSLTQRDQAGIR